MEKKTGDLQEIPPDHLQAEVGLPELGSNPCSGEMMSDLRVLKISVLNNFATEAAFSNKKSKKISNDQELIQSDPTSCPQNQKGKN